VNKIITVIHNSIPQLLTLLVKAYIQAQEKIKFSFVLQGVANLAKIRSSQQQSLN
jgi:hypothetical protein